MDSTMTPCQLYVPASCSTRHAQALAFLSYIVTVSKTQRRTAAATACNVLLDIALRTRRARLEPRTDRGYNYRDAREEGITKD